MWMYDKRLEYPVKVGKSDVKMAKYLLTQYGGPDGELSAAIRYLNQRYTIPTNRAKGLLTDIGTEELAHWEMIGTMIYQLLKGVSPQKLIEAGLGAHYATHDNALFPQDAAGVPWTASYIQATGDPIADLQEDMAAEAKAKAAYERLINMTDDVGLIDSLKFLRERKVVHFQRIGKAFRL